MAQPLTPEAMAEFAQLADAQISPDGALVAFVAGAYFTTDTRAPKSQIWLAPADGSAPARAFTHGRRADTAPRWSPDGRTLAFLSDRQADGCPQIYLIGLDGGEARQLTDLPGAIEQLAWSPDGARLAFLIDDPESDEQRRRRAAKDDAIEVERHHRWRRLWTVDCASGKAGPLTGEVQVWEFDWAPDGGFVLLISAEPYEWSWFSAQLTRIGPEGGPPELIYSAPEKQFACPRIAPDGRSVAFLSCILSDRGINGGEVLLLPLDAPGAAPRQLTPGYDGSIWAMQWRPGGTALDYMAFEQGEAAIGWADVSGERTTLWRGPAGFCEHYVGQFRARDSAAFAVVGEDATDPQDVWVAQAASDSAPLVWRQISDVHPQPGQHALGETRRLSWRAHDGRTIDGQLILPVGYHDGQRAPLITWVHGGPAWLWMHGFYGAGRLAPQLFAGAGYAVLLPNPRGSTGWGVEFTEATIGDYGGGDYQDILDGIEHVVALGIADPARLGIGGWSYGGFMSAWAVTQTDRFKAAIMGAGICNWRSFHGVAEIGAWDRIGLRADPFTPGNRYDQRSPINYVHNARTPTLILHGDSDTIVPPSQSYEFFRALKDRGVPTELVIYPREPHGLRERAHNLDRLRRYLAWFQRYL